MRLLSFIAAAALLCCSLAAAQTGTNDAQSQQMTKPRTGNAANTITSPDVNSAATGTEGNTLGTSGDLNRNGTNGARGQQMTNPRTGRASDNITSPDVNSAITGTRGSTVGTPGDVATQPVPAEAGAASAAAESTAAVSTREQMERASLRAREGQNRAPLQKKNTASVRDRHSKAGVHPETANKPQRPQPRQP